MRLAVIGAGPGGYVAALKAAQLGANVIVIEDTEVGGTCLNRGCIPTKALLASSEAYAKAKVLEKFGLELNGTVRPNLEKIMSRKDKIVSTQVNGIRGLLKSWGIILLEGRGMLLGPRKIEITKNDGSLEIVNVDKTIIATGSRPTPLSAFPFDGINILSSDDALKLSEIPTSMIIVGAGIIGCEFACIFHELGTEVTLIEMLSRTVSTEDEEISKILEKELRKKNIKILTSVRVDKIAVTGDGVTATLGDGQELKAHKMLVSIGRSINSSGIGLENAGISMGQLGEISVSDKMQTNIEDVYAVGDVTGGTMLAHVASKEGAVAASNACGIDATVDYSAVPSAIFTSPEIGSVGLREFQAKERGIKVKTGHFQFRAVGKAHAMGEIAGLLKVVADYDSDTVLGTHIIGPHASDIIHEAALAVRKELKVKDIADTIHAHPTLSEGLMEAAGDVKGEAIHMPRK